MPIVLNGSGPVTGVTSLNTTVSDTEIGYLDGVTSALQTQINTAGGLVKITDSTFSAQSTVSVNNCFSSTYDYYRVIVRATSSTAANMQIRLRASGTDASGANTYKTQMIEGFSTSSSFSARSEAQFLSGWIDSTKVGTMQIEFYGPNLAASTGVQIIGGRFDDAALFVGEHTTASAYDGFTFYPSSGTVTGTLRVYGYRN